MKIDAKERTARRRLRWPWLLVGAVVVWWLAGFGGALLVTRGHAAPMPSLRALCQCPVEAVSVPTADGLTVRGWLVRAGPDSHDCVVLSTGIRGNRLAMQSRAEWYLARGWSTLLVDLRGNGESDPAPVSMGFHEANDLHAWREWLRGLGFSVVGAHGLSLGAAAIAYSDGTWAFAVLEACYADIDGAMHARLPWIPLPELALWPLRCCSEWLSGVDADQLRPVEHVARLRNPTLFVCGEDDTKVGPDASRRLLVACGAAAKHLVTITGAGHVDLLGHDGPAWRAALDAFVPAATR